MTLNEYLLEWQKDAQIPPDDLDTTARNVPLLHAKWWRFFAYERLQYKQVELKYKRLHQQKFEWYNGTMLDEDRIALGWQPNHRKILTASIPRYLDADTDLQTLVLQRATQEETLRFLEDVIKSINSRGYLISTTVNYLRFKSGN